MNNTLGLAAQNAIRFATLLRERFGLEVVLWDERLSTRSANAVLQEQGYDSRQKRRIVDMVAATIILESFLQSENEKMNPSFL